MIRGADHHRLVFGSPVAHVVHVAVERTLVLESEEQTRDDERDSGRERKADQAMYKAKLDRLLGDGTPVIVSLAETPLLGSRQEWEYKSKSDEEHRNHHTNQDVGGIGALLNRLDEHVSALAKEEIDPAVVEAGYLPQRNHNRDCQCNNAQTLEEHLDPEPPPHRPDELVVAPFGDERHGDPTDREQDKKNFANHEQDFHPTTSCIWFGMCDQATMARLYINILRNKSQETANRRLLDSNSYD